jgi:phytanoyl-CoA hydroxylase
LVTPLANKLARACAACVIRWRKNAAPMSHVSQSHTRARICDSGLYAAKFLRTDLDENRALLQTQVAAELDPGDVLFFHCRLFHAAGNNQSADTKFSVVFTYHASDNRPLPGTRSASLPSISLQSPE